MANHHNYEEYLGCETDKVVGQDADVQAKNRDFDEEQRKGIDDRGGECSLR